MFSMCYHITIGNYELKLLDSVEIKRSVDMLSDEATIVVPDTYHNKTFHIENRVKIGDKVEIKFGYDDNLQTEFIGYLYRIYTDDGSISFKCEDGLYLMRKSVADKEFNKAKVSDIARYLLAQTGYSKLECTYDITYEKFVIKSANAFGVLKALKDDTNASIYMIDDVLHIHPQYIEKGGDAYYDFAYNVEKPELKYKNADDRIFEVEVEGISLDGKKRKVTVGSTGGEKRSIKINNVLSESELKKRGNEELKHLSFNGYEGSITTWLIPYVEPTYTAHIKDDDYEYRTGAYYVKSVTTTFSSSGGVRKVELGIKVRGNG